MNELMKLAAKRAAKKRKRRAALHSKSKSRKAKPVSAAPQPGTIDQDRLLSQTVRDAAAAFNAALANAKAAGVEVQQHLVEAETIGDEPMIIAHPIKLGRIIRRY